MRKDGLGKMLWLRHRWVYGLLIALAVVGVLFSVTQTVGNYRMSVNYARSVATKHKGGHTEFNSAKYTQILSHSTPIYTTKYMDEKSNPHAIPYNENSGGVVTSYTLLILAAILGITLVSWDRMGRFERFLFASPFSRRHVYWRRFTQGLSVLVGVVAVFYLVNFAALFMFIPAQHVNITVLGILETWLYNVVADAALYAAATWCALLFGNALVAAIVGAVGFVLLDSFQKTAQFVGFALTHANSGNFFRQSFISLRSPDRFWPQALLIMVVGGLIFALWSAPIFAGTSSERTHHVLAYPRMKWPLIVIMAVLGATYVADSVDFSSNVMVLDLLVRMVLPGMIAGGATWLLVSFGALRRRWFNRRDARAKA